MSDSVPAAPFGDILAHDRRDGPYPSAAESGDLYASVMAKEASVLELVRRLDDTRRAEAIRSSDKIAPLVMAFAKGVSGYMARMVHYLSSGATKEAIALATSPDGMVYTGAIVLFISAILAFM